MVKRSAILAFGLFLGLFAFAGRADALVGITVQVGGGFIPSGSRPGAVAQVELGPLSPFAEFFKKSGQTTTNLGLDLIALKLPLPIVQPYAGFGGGISRTSESGVSKSRLMVTGLAGANLKLTSTKGIFAQIKYFYTIGSGKLIVRQVALQAGISFSLGI